MAIQVIHITYFWISGKPMRDFISISLYTNVGFISKVPKDIASESTENRNFRHSTVFREPHEYPHKPYTARN